MKKKSSMTKEELLKKLNYERENGYPSFKKEIAKVLCDRYNIEAESAHQIVWNEKIGTEIAEDIEWSQHMGPNYWAELITREFSSELPRRLKNQFMQV